MRETIKNVTAAAAFATILGVFFHWHNLSIEALESEYTAQIRTSQLRAEAAEKEKPHLSLLQLYLKDVLVHADSPSLVDSSLQYFSSDGFYAQKFTPGWQYSLLTSEQLNRLSNKSIVIDKQIRELTESLNIPKVHLWRGDAELTFKDRNGETKFFPSILVQRFEYSMLIELFARLTGHPKDCGAGGVSPCSGQAQKLKGAVDALRSSTSIDPSLMYFLMQLSRKYSLMMSSDEYRFKLYTMSKHGNVITAKLSSIMTGLSESSEPIAVHIHEDIAIISNNSELILVHVLIPSTRPGVDSSHRAFADNFLSNFKVIIQSP